MLAPKQKNSEILEQLSVYGRKNASEFMIQRWKRQAKSLSDTDIVDSKRLLAIIAVYENDFDATNKYFDQALFFSGNESSSVYNDYAQALIMQGRGMDALGCYFKAFTINPSVSNLENIVGLSLGLLYIDVLRDVASIATKLNINTEIYFPIINRAIDKINRSVAFFDNIELSLESYRAVIDLSDYIAHKKFYTQKKLSYHHLDNMFGVIIHPENLTPNEVSELNDDFTESIVNLNIPYEDILKLSVYFSFYDLKDSEVA